MNNWPVNPPPANWYPEPKLSMEDSLQKFRVRPERFEQIDFYNRSYGPYQLSDGTKINLNLAQRRLYLPENSGWFELKDVYYTDMTADGEPEAIVWLSHVTCGGGVCNGGSNLFYVYTKNKGKLKPIWQYETGSYGVGCGLQSFTAGGTQIVVELFGRCPGLDHPDLSEFTAQDLTFIRFEFDGQRFAQKSVEYLNSLTSNPQSYEPGIRIY